MDWQLENEVNIKDTEWDAANQISHLNSPLSLHRGADEGHLITPSLRKATRCEPFRIRCRQYKKKLVRNNFRAILSNSILRSVSAGVAVLLPSAPSIINLLEFNYLLALSASDLVDMTDWWRIVARTERSRSGPCRCLHRVVKARWLIPMTHASETGAINRLHFLAPKIKASKWFNIMSSAVHCTG